MVSNKHKLYRYSNDFLVVIGIILTIVIFLCGIFILSSIIEEQGGVRQVIVDTGKEIKSIYNDINEE